MEIPEYLLNKYNAAVPRYTSYPPANHFREDINGENFLTAIIESNNGNPRNISLYLHIPFCKKICYYCGCNSCPTGKGDMIEPYISSLKKEIELIAGHIDKSRLVSQIHYGGGTPNSIDLRHLKDLNNLIFSKFRLIDNPEIAIECNPEFLTPESMDNLLAAGFNRFSLGIQDFDSSILKLVNRNPSKLPPADLFSHLKKNGAHVNFDFIYGLPGQTVASFNETIDKAIAIRPDRLVTFSYAHVPWLKKHQQILEKRGLPATEEKMKMFLSGSEKLKNAGYQPLGLDHFVLPEDDLFVAYRDHQLHRNFQGYCTRRTTGQVYAFGVTAISQLESGYAQNTKDLKVYMDTLDKGKLPVERGYLLNDTQKVTREVINRLMCNKKISFSEIAEYQNISIEKLKEIVNFREERLKELIADGLLNYSDDSVEVTEKGTMFIRNIAVIFDREYEEKNQTYSRTV